jgi:hypothetical protein
MDLKKFRQIIREEVQKAIQDELKDILSEAVKIASTPQNPTFQPQPYIKTESTIKPKNSEILAKNNIPTSTGNPLLDILNETANSGEWKSLNSGYTSQDAAGWGGGINTPIVNTVNQMITNQGPVNNVNDINDIRIDAVPDFTGLMKNLKEKGKL